jgi:hypothetical protein
MRATTGTLSGNARDEPGTRDQTIHSGLTPRHEACYASARSHQRDIVGAVHQEGDLVRLTRGLVAVGMGAIVSLAGAAGASETSAQECHYAYGGCLPVVYDLDCAEIGYAVVEVWNVYDDPYDLDAVGIPGNGWTCDGIG